MTVIRVGGDQPYDVLVGRDLTDRLPSLLPGAAQVAVLHTASVHTLADQAMAALRSAGMAVPRSSIVSATRRDMSSGSLSVRPPPE